MRTVKYETQENRESEIEKARLLGEQKYRDETWPDGTKVLVFRNPQPTWVEYFQIVMPRGRALEDTPFAEWRTEAIEYQMGVIRKARNLELAAKDVTFMRAIEAGDTDAQATIATEKQVLRDLPATFDITTDAGTPELLKAKWPTELPARE